MSSLLVWQVGNKTSLQVGASGDHPSPNYQAKIIFLVSVFIPLLMWKCFLLINPPFSDGINANCACLCFTHWMQVNLVDMELSERVRSKLSNVDPG